jgi:uncharacterized radical SAM superfamily protein
MGAWIIEFLERDTDEESAQKNNNRNKKVKMRELCGLLEKAGYVSDYKVTRVLDAYKNRYCGLNCDYCKEKILELYIDTKANYG